MAGTDRGGAIVNLTSINGVSPGPYAGAYGSTKAAIALLMEIVVGRQVELPQDIGVRVEA